MLTVILLNILGIGLFYLNRYKKRKTTDKFNPKFWLEENWPELTITLIINAMCLILLLHPKTNIDVFISKKLPDGLDIVVPHLMSALLGLGLAWRIYEKVNEIIDKLFR